MKPSQKQKLSLINPDAAGIDVGSQVHYVCVPQGRCETPVRKFDCFTPDLYALAAWLKSCGIKTVAMESTGVYWIPLFQVLETQGFDVKLVNAKHVKTVPGRKSDVQDCQWLQQPHSYGLLQGSFRPADEICVLRSYNRQRQTLIRSAAIHVQRMQKALTQMNLQLHKVLADITGVTGMHIIEAILQGERNPESLASLKDNRARKDHATFVKALTGDWRSEHLFTLAQEWALYKVYQEKMEECDREIEKCYQSFEAKSSAPIKPLTRKPRKNHPPFNVNDELLRMTGLDFTKVPGMDGLTIQTIIAEVGLDAGRWPSEKHFTSWLGLSPANKITGEKVISARTRKVNNRAAHSFRLAAYAVSNTQTALGAYCRRLKARLGSPKALTACARKLAFIFYHLLKYGHGYVERGMEQYERLYEQRTLKSLQKKASELGYQLTPTPAPTG